MTLADLNAIVWERDGAACLLCGSHQIIGEPYISGAHHLFSKAAHPEMLLVEKNLCLLCWRCHQNANRAPMIRKLLYILHLKHPEYDYTEAPYSSYWDPNNHLEPQL